MAASTIEEDGLEESAKKRPIVEEYDIFHTSTTVVAQISHTDRVLRLSSRPLSIRQMIWPECLQRAGESSPKQFRIYVRQNSIEMLDAKWREVTVDERMRRQ